ncbi:hypothetical protein ONS96_009520 [Cadophora gregata f. sp. sojae]|nr:hypothetical protein ONS96_009520 [Cadophora gregata f. sp. sojae]
MNSKAKLDPACAGAVSVPCKARVSSMARVTALHVAAEKKKYDIVPLLIENGANVFALDGFGRNPLGRILSNGLQLNFDAYPQGRVPSEGLSKLCAWF